MSTQDKVEDMDLQYFPFYYRKFMDGVRGETPEFIGVYMMLLCRQAEKKRIQLDLPKLSRWMGGADVKLIDHVLQTKFKNDGDGYFNEVLENVLIKVEMKVEDRRKRARDAASKRWKSTQDQDIEAKNVTKKPDAEALQPHTMGTAQAMHMHTECTADALPVQSIGNPNKSKVKESKVNKSKVNVVVVEGDQPQPQPHQPPSKSEFIEFCLSVDLSTEETNRIWAYYDNSKEPSSDNPDAWRKKNGTIIANWRQHLASVWLKDRKPNGKSRTSNNVAGWRQTTSS